jgi:hypothetical protein
MTQITRVYDSSKSATDAVAELKTRGFKDVDVVAAPQSRGGRSNGGDVVQSVKKTGIPSNYVEAYAERVKRGGAVVTVSAPFGTASTAADILNKYGPDKAPGPASSSGNGADTSAAPLSSALHIPLLTESSGGTSGSVTGSWTLSSALGLPELISSNSFFSGFPLLTDSKPFSSLSHSQAPWSSLARSQEPFSSLSSNQNGSASLVNDPTPLSSMLGLPVLLKS